MKKIATLLIATTALTACNSDLSAKQEMTEEQVKLIIDNYIEENPAKILESVNSYMAKMQAEQIKEQEAAQAKALEEAFLSPIQVELDEMTPVKGSDSAPITIVEFSDFECPFCQRVTPTLDSILKKYPGKVKVAYKHLPLDFHANAKPAALASIAAFQQGKFWEFHDAIFRNMQNLNEETYLKIAKDLELDIEQFKKDMASKTATVVLEQNIQQAAALGIQGTPHFLVNGVPLSGALPEEEFVKVIERLLDDMNK